jgi:hypothetical protein
MIAFSNFKSRDPAHGARVPSLSGRAGILKRILKRDFFVGWMSFRSEGPSAQVIHPLPFSIAIINNPCQGLKQRSPAPTVNRATTCLGEGGGTCDPQPEGAQARAALAAASLDPSRSSAVAPVDHRALCAEGGCARTARASACSTAEGAGGRVSTPPACLHRSSVGRGCRITRLGPHGAAACSRRARFATPSSGVLAELRGAKAAGRILGIGASRGADCVVLRVCRGVGGDVPRLGQGAGHPRITQRRRVVALEPKLHPLGVAG